MVSFSKALYKANDKPEALYDVGFSKANVKLEALYDVPELSSWLTDKRKIYSFDLLSGWSCPFARNCMSKVVEIEGKRKIQDGKHMEFRCFSASQEAVFPSAYNKRKANFDYMKSCNSTDEMVDEIVSALPKNLGICRIHVAGDFFNQKYFRAWREVARLCSDRLFYAYTKSLSWWVEDRDHLPDNLVLTASRGGSQDDLINTHSLREAKVVFSEAEADALGYEIDHTDEHAAIPEIRERSFALLLHGQQAKGSKASDAIKELKRKGVKFSYNRKAKV